MPNIPLTELEYRWFASRSSIVSTVPIGVHKFSYFARGSLASVGLKPLGQVEKEWLSLITGLADTQGDQAMWKAAVAQYGNGVASENSVQYNKWLFYSAATLSNLP